MSDDKTTAAPRHGRLIAAGFIGNVLEWYDFAVYGFFAGTIGLLFFPSGDPTSSLIAAFGAFAAGFFMRPLGSIFFGHLGDRLGRRQLLVVSASTMGLATFAVGLLPTNADIGAAAAVLMVVLRMAQGLSVGGEYIGSGVYLTESAPRHRRGFFASFSTAGAMAGILLGSAVGALVTTLLTPDQIIAWGWRVPFWAGLLFAIVALVVRFSVPDSPKPPDRATLPFVEAIRDHRKTIAHAAALVVVIASNYYVIVVFVPDWLARHTGMDRSAALEINTVNIVIAIAAGLVSAAVSDRIGRRRVLMAAALGTAILTYPMFWLMSGGDPMTVAMAQCVLGVLNAIYAFLLPSTLAEMFPWRVRTTSANLSLNVTLAVFGGTAPMVATWLVAETGDLTAVAVYLSLLAVLSGIACFFLTDRHNVDLN